MREWDLLDTIRSAGAAQPDAFPHVLVPPGDDCAAVQMDEGILLLKVDQVVEGRHFVSPASWEAGPFAGGCSREGFIDLVARKAVARALSDIAAMGGRPLACMAAAALPHGFPHKAAEELAAALHRWGGHWKCPVVGGDVASFAAAHPGPMTLGVSVMGRAHSTRGPVLRSGATDGDGVFVTGALGGSLHSDGLGRHMTFNPRLDEAYALAETLGCRLTAMMDISDGLGVDAGRLARASGVTLLMEEHLVPLNIGSDARAALSDGEDYELLFTATGPVPSRLGDTPVTRIGSVCSGTAGAMLRRADGSTIDVSRLGWQHS